MELQYALAEHGLDVRGVGVGGQLEAAFELVLEPLTSRKALSVSSVDSTRAPVTVTVWSETSIPSSFSS